jgi:hypothetical membrane protein
MGERGDLQLDPSLDRGEPRSKLGLGLVLTASLGPFLWIAGAIVSGVRREGYSFRRQAISELGIGTDAWILNVSLVLTGVSIAIFAFGFYLLMPWLPRRRLASALLAVVSVCFVVLGVFPLAESQEPTLSELLHYSVGFFTGMSIMAAALFVIGAGLKSDPTWEGHRLYTLASGWVMAVLVPLQFFTFNPASPLADLEVAGIFEWALLLTPSIWLLVTGRRLARPTLRSVPAGTRKAVVIKG